MNCVFCEIVAGKKPDEVVLYEDEFVMAFFPFRKDAPTYEMSRKITAQFQ